MSSIMKSGRRLDEDPVTKDGAEITKVKTLADLGKIAGVTAGTVSRALAGSELVNKRTRERILALAHEHGFQLNQIASKLRSKRTGMIGVVIPLGHERNQHISDPFFMTLLGHLADEITERGYSIVLERAIPEEKPDWLDRICGSGMVDGVILIGQSNQFATIERIAETYRPLVAWGSYQEGQLHCAVGTDNRAGGEIAARRLLAGGATRLAFLGETTGVEIAERFAGVKDVADEVGASLVHLPCHMSFELMTGELESLLAQHDGDFDGIIAASDLIAMTALKVLYGLGKRVPEDVQVIGYDDLPLAAQTMPPLTTIHQDISGGAREIVQRLQSAIAGRDVASLVMAPKLIERETTRGLA
ncbi:LacI family DNA-binding transcriptional regulator [Novosphingobium pentaromativorans]|uniref:LacI family transcription regulator n=1 Tax=Novosphingobium pentaromativorans US6-1 TaxID=1088721 RepID=G6EIR8_9SPHN|nr:substrate-binding domain-containing protein [Novosphingobium pentaromativorans]EHJ59010.1 LacI family transcription regulator [Novosphingobium pentaromativorans US6-1]